MTGRPDELRQRGSALLVTLLLMLLITSVTLSLLRETLAVWQAEAAYSGSSRFGILAQQISREFLFRLNLNARPSASLAEGGSSWSGHLGSGDLSIVVPSVDEQCCWRKWFADELDFPDISLTWAFISPQESVESASYRIDFRPQQDELGAPLGFDPQSSSLIAINSSGAGIDQLLVAELEISDDSQSHAWRQDLLRPLVKWIPEDAFSWNERRPAIEIVNCGSDDLDWNLQHAELWRPDIDYEGFFRAAGGSYESVVGRGILFIEGDAEFLGTVVWQGLLWVEGEVIFHQGSVLQGIGLSRGPVVDVQPHLTTHVDDPDWLATRRDLWKWRPLRLIRLY